MDEVIQQVASEFLKDLPPHDMSDVEVETMRTDLVFKMKRANLFPIQNTAEAQLLQAYRETVSKLPTGTKLSVDFKASPPPKHSGLVNLSGQPI